jgi:hypothetical protein
LPFLISTLKSMTMADRALFALIAFFAGSAWRGIERDISLAGVFLAVAFPAGAFLLMLIPARVLALVLARVRGACRAPSKAVPGVGV